MSELAQLVCLNLLETCTTHNTATLGFYVLILGPCIKQKKLRGLVGAITMFKQATRASATPTGLPPSRVICHDPWVSLVLTCLTVAAILAYIYKHGRQLSLIYGHRFTNICKVYVLISNHTHYVKVKVAEMCGNPNLFTCNKTLEMNNVTMQKGYVWDHGRSQNTVPIASTQVAIKGIIQSVSQ